jgi:hypothetical protein
MGCSSTPGTQDITDVDDAGSTGSADAWLPEGAPVDGETADQTSSDTHTTDDQSSDAAHVGDAPADAHECDGGLQTDPNNCGSCGHSCLGGACSAGVCQPVAIITEQTLGLEVAADDTNVYWVNSTAGAGNVVGTIKQHALAGGTPVVVSGNESYPGQLQVSGSRLYWLTQTGTSAFSTSLRSAPVGGAGTVSIVATLTGIRTALAVTPDGSREIFSAFAPSNDQYMIDVQHGSSGATFGPTNGRIGAMIADNAVAYMADVHGFLVSFPFSGGVSNVLAYGMPGMFGVAGDTSRLFVLGAHRIDTYVPGGSQLQPFATGLHNPRNLVVDGTQVYWTDSADGAVYRMPVGGGAQVKVASGQPAAQYIAQNSTSVFWTTLSGSTGTIMRLAK